MKASGVPSPGQTWRAGPRERASAGRCSAVCLPRSSAERRERVLPALLHTHGEAWEKSLWLRGSGARLRKPAGSRGDPASGKVLCEVQDPRAEGQRPCCPHGHAGVAAGARCRPGGGSLPAAGQARPGGNARAFAGSSAEQFGGRRGHLCPCAPREGPPRGRAGRSPLSHAAGIRGSPPRSERRSRGAPQHFGQGVGVRIHSSSPHLRGGGGCT